MSLYDSRSVFSASGAASDTDTISVSDDAPVETGSHHAAQPVDISTWGQIQREDVKEEVKEEDLEKSVHITLTVSVINE